MGYENQVGSGSGNEASCGSVVGCVVSCHVHFCNLQLACKSDREFRACEIAGLMVDEHSVSSAHPQIYYSLSI